MPIFAITVVCPLARLKRRASFGTTGIALLVCALLTSPPAPADELAPFPPLYPDAEIFSRAIDAAAALPIAPRKLSGLTVPNDLRAIDAIARGFRVAAGNDYDKI